MQFKHNRNLTFYLAIFIIVQGAQCASSNDGNGIDPEDLNGRKLVEFGIKLNKTMLQLIGKTIENVEDKICDFHSCLAWTEWGECTARSGQFGSKSRTRQCSINKTTCEIEANSKMETEFGVCAKYCPKDYNITKHGFCVKLYADKLRTQDAAEQRCQKDGGHLINIDSQTKYEDVKGLKTAFGSYDWIDGRRKTASSSWEYKYGSQKGFFKWRYGRPNGGLCLKVYLRTSGMLWYDSYCTSSYHSICEYTYN